MKQLTRNYILLFIGFFIINTHPFAEEINWERGPKTQNILNLATIFLPEDFVALGIEETDKYLKLSENIPSGSDNYYGPNSDLWDGYFSFNKVGYIKDDDDIDNDELLDMMKNGMKSSNKYRLEKGWGTMTLLGWEYQPKYEKNSKRLSWAFLLLDDDSNNKIVNYETRILGRNGVMSVTLVTSPENLNRSIIELNNSLSTFKFNSGERYSEYKKGDRVAEFGLAALIAGGAAAVASKKGLWAILMGLLIAAKKFAFVIIIGLFAGIASLFKRKK